MVWKTQRAKGPLFFLPQQRMNRCRYLSTGTRQQQQKNNNLLFFFFFSLFLGLVVLKTPFFFVCFGFAISLK
jgi:hypothetical protein